MERIGIDTLHKLFYGHPPNARDFLLTSVSYRVILYLTFRLNVKGVIA